MIFDDLKEIRELYEEGEIPEPEELSGEYYVVAPWFPWFSLAALKHRKDVGDGGEGDNVLAGGFRFGHFVLENDGDSLLINYDNDENMKPIRGVRDRLRRLPDGRIVGKLFYEVFGKEVFLMFFEMVPKED